MPFSYRTYSIVCFLLFDSRFRWFFYRVVSAVSVVLTTCWDSERTIANKTELTACRYRNIGTLRKTINNFAFFYSQRTLTFKTKWNQFVDLCRVNLSAICTESRGETDQGFVLFRNGKGKKWIKQSSCSKNENGSDFLFLFTGLDTQF